MVRRENLFVTQPMLLKAQYQEMMGQGTPVVVLPVCETIANSRFGLSRTVTCFMLMSDGCIVQYDSAVLDRLGGKGWEETTFSRCDYLGDGIIPKDLEEIKNLEEENMDAMIQEQREEEVMMEEVMMDQLYGEII